MSKTVYVEYCPTKMYDTLHEAILDQFDWVRVKITATGFSLYYKLKHCNPSTDYYSYTDEFTENEVIKDFCCGKGLKILRCNGYVFTRGINEL